MKKLALLLLFVAVGAWGQDAKIGITDSSWGPGSTVPHAKPCAFGFMSKSVFGLPKPAPPTPKKELNDSLNVSPFVATTTGLYYHQICPYERAIELFGQDRVEYRKAQRCDTDVKPEDVCPSDPWKKIGHGNGYHWVNQILVDGEVVYEEPPQ